MIPLIWPSFPFDTMRTVSIFDQAHKKHFHRRRPGLVASKITVSVAWPLQRTWPTNCPLINTIIGSDGACMHACECECCSLSSINLFRGRPRPRQDDDTQARAWSALPIHSQGSNCSASVVTCVLVVPSPAFSHASRLIEQL